MSTSKVKDLDQILSKIQGKAQISAGFGDSGLEEGDPCPVCGGLGFFTVNVEPDHPAFGKSIPCNCQEAIRVARLWRRSGLLEEERDWEMSYVANMAGKVEAYQLVMATMGKEPPAGWVVLYGAFGVGKSGLLKSAVAHAINAGIPAMYARSEDVLAEARASFDDKSASELDVKGRYVQVPVLALDEVDRVSMTDWAQGFLFGLLDERYNRRAQSVTLMATNKKIGQMGPEWAYLESRMSDGLIANMAGQSLRGG